jgi:glycosyltransferase involved in cell wall biosynthesis
MGRNDEGNTGEGKPKICVISFPQPSASVVNVFLYSLVEILEPICEWVYVLTSNIPKDRTFSEKIRIQDLKTAMHFRDTIRPMWWSTMLQFFKIIIIQIKMCWTLTKISKETDIIIFYIGGANFFLPVLMAKALRKKVVTLAPGRGSLSYKKPRNERLLSIDGAFAAIFSVLERANFFLADQIAVESESSIGFLGLNKYRKKIFISSSLYINFNLFKGKKDLKDRRNLIGYIGRLSPEKGVLNFVKAIPLILKEREDLEFLIGGAGPLLDEIKSELKNSRSYDKVELTGWIPHDELPDYLNELKLIVAPSYSEGGVPAVIMEAMACGTMILVTPVAGVDIIKDGETGFILEDNSPECITKNVIRVLEHPNLDEIVNNARNLVEKEYSYENTVRQYRDMLYRVLYNQE